MPPLCGDATFIGGTPSRPLEHKHSPRQRALDCIQGATHINEQLDWNRCRDFPDENEFGVPFEAGMDHAFVDAIAHGRLHIGRREMI